MENKEIKLFVKNKEVKGFIIDLIDGYYKIGTYLGIQYQKKEVIDELNKEQYMDDFLIKTMKNQEIYKKVRKEVYNHLRRS